MILQHEPETLHPWLPSAGYMYERATKHTFVRYEEVDPNSLIHPGGPRGLAPGQALIYRCDETGVERRWGIE